MANLQVTKNGHIYWTMMSCDFFLDISLKCIDNIDEYLILMEQVEAADAPWIDFQVLAKLFFHDKLEAKI